MSPYDEALGLLAVEPGTEGSGPNPALEPEPKPAGGVVEENVEDEDEEGEDLYDYGEEDDDDGDDVEEQAAAATLDAFSLLLLGNLQECAHG